MNHPNEQEWMEFLYKELPAGQRSAVEKHLRDCGDCTRRRAELEGTSRRLDSWNVQARPTQRLTANSGLRWAAAAALLISTAFAGGRWTKAAASKEEIAAVEVRVASSVEKTLAERLHAQLGQQMRDEVAKTIAEMRVKVQEDLASALKSVEAATVADAAAANRKQLEELQVQLAAIREEDRKTVYAALEKLDAQRVTEYRRLREDLEKVALFTDQNFRDAQRKLVQLAGYATQTPVSQ